MFMAYFHYKRYIIEKRKNEGFMHKSNTTSLKVCKVKFAVIYRADCDLRWKSMDHCTGRFDRFIKQD